MKHKQLVILVTITVLILQYSCVVLDQGPSSVDEVIYVRHKGADMPAYVHGNISENIFLLVVHGAGSFGLAFRDGAFTSEFEERYAVVYWDQRGQSMSQGHYSSPEDIVALMAEDLMALVGVLRHKYGQEIRLFLMGHSWGGALSATALVKDQQQLQFNGWIDVDGVHDFPLAGNARKQLLLSIADEQIALGNHPSEWKKIITTIVELDSTSSEGYEKILAQLPEAIGLLRKDSVVNPGGASAEKLIEAIVVNNPIHWLVSDLFNKPFAQARDMNYSVADKLSLIQIPALIIFGKYDLSAPPALGVDAMSRLGSSDKKLVIFERSIHHPQDTEPDLFATEVMDFIERNK